MLKDGIKSLHQGFQESRALGDILRLEYLRRVDEWLIERDRACLTSRSVVGPIGLEVDRRVHYLDPADRHLDEFGLEFFA